MVCIFQNNNTPRASTQISRQTHMTIVIQLLSMLHLWAGFREVGRCHLISSYFAMLCSPINLQRHYHYTDPLR